MKKALSVLQGLQRERAWMVCGMRRSGGLGYGGLGSQIRAFNDEGDAAVAKAGEQGVDHVRVVEESAPLVVAEVGGDEGGLFGLITEMSPQ